MMSAVYFIMLSLFLSSHHNLIVFNVFDVFIISTSKYSLTHLFIYLFIPGPKCHFIAFMPIAFFFRIAIIWRNFVSKNMNSPPGKIALHYEVIKNYSDKFTRHGYFLLAS